MATFVGYDTPVRCGTGSYTIFMDATRAFLAAREAAIKVGIPDEVAVYRLADQMIRERDQQRLG